jgi:hypothetical protein
MYSPAKAMRGLPARRAMLPVLGACVMRPTRPFHFIHTLVALKSCIAIFIAISRHQVNRDARNNQIRRDCNQQLSIERLKKRKTLQKWDLRGYRNTGK